MQQFVLKALYRYIHVDVYTFMHMFAINSARLVASVHVRYIVMVLEMGDLVKTQKGTMLKPQCANIHIETVLSN